MVFSNVSIVVIAHNREKSIGSTIMILKSELSENSPNIVVIDNGSTDRTAEITTKVGAKVFRYRIRKDRREIIRRALIRGSRQDSNIIFILDLVGENTADDVISLFKQGKSYGEKFATGYIHPHDGADTIGCWAFDKKMLENIIQEEGDIEDVFFKIAQSHDLDEDNISEIIERAKKKKIKKKMQLKDFRLLYSINKWRKNNPLKFFGGWGLLFFFSSLLTTFYTVDYFYKHQHLAYFPAFITVVLVMTSGFFFVTGLMINAFNTLIERLEAISEWVD